MINKNKVELILRKIWSKIKVKIIKKFKRGYTLSDDYLIVTENPNKKLVLRLKDKKKALNIEKKIGSLVRGIPIPKVYLKETERKLEGDYYSIIEKMEGEHFDEVIPRLKTEEIKKLSYELGEIIGKIHSVKNKYYGKITRDKSSYGYYGTFYDYYSWRIQEILDDALKAKLDEKLVEKFIDFVDKNKELVKFKKNASLTHYDLYPDNIFVKNGKISGIIDWHGARWSDNELDLIKVKWWIFPLSKHIEKSFFKGYTKHVRLSPDFRNKMKFYEIIEAMAYVVWGKLIKDNSLVKEFMPLLEKRLK